MFRILHRSRIENQYQEEEHDDEKICILETFYRKSQDTGVQIGNHLREQVRQAIELLGNGFTEHLLWQEMEPAEIRELYGEIMNVIYRLLFLMFAEQKGWLPVHHEIYSKTYSINALRIKAEKDANPEDSYTDLWDGLKITFRLVAKGYTFPNGETINAFGGQLFSDRKIRLIKELPVKNKYILGAIHRLSFFEDQKIRHKINYTTLAIDALGSVYESLLDYEPSLAHATAAFKNRILVPGEFFLDDRSSERKTTGSYYTDHRLVGQLINSALVPVIEKALENKHTASEQEQALLDLKICDMACGSGAFLIAALEKLGEYLAKIIKGDEELPTEEQFRNAKHKALLHCIYGVDLNPMAIELAKFSLWITASMPNMPLSFLDHKLRHGNSLVGATKELVKNCIPPAAYNPHTLDNKEICQKLKKRVSKELEVLGKAEEPASYYSMGLDVTGDFDLLASHNRINEIEQENTDQVEEAEEEYHRLEHEERHYKDFLLSDCWTAAFFIPRTDHALDNYITNRTLQAIRDNQPVNRVILDWVDQVCKENNFFHWKLEFPEVFNKEKGQPGGFDCILGNPPWERVKLVEKEFFLTRNFAIANAPTASHRNELIKKLVDTNPNLLIEYQKACYNAEATAGFLIHSGRYPLLGKGDVNTYTVFTENFRSLINPNGRMGVIVPTGIATDDTTKDFFRDIVGIKTLVSLFDFENRKGLFSDVHRMFRFCLLTINGSSHPNPFDFLFYATGVEQLADEWRHFSLTREELLMINPNTGNCPVFRSKRDAEIVKKIYSRFPVMIREDTGENIWNISYSRMFDMANDSSLFKTRKDLESDGFHLTGNLFINADEKYLPLYEAKMIWHYDHRYGTYENFDFDNDGSTHLPSPTLNQYRDPDYEPLPRYWVNEKNMPMLARVPEFVLRKFNPDSINIEQIPAFWSEFTDWMIGSYLLLNEESKAMMLWHKHKPDQKSTQFNPEYFKSKAIFFPLNASELSQLELNGKENAIEIILSRRWKWFIGFRDVTNATNERTSIVSVVPFSAIGHKLPIILLKKDLVPVHILIGCLNSIILDYILRQKIAGTSFGFFIFKQLPIINFQHVTDSVSQLIKDKVEELSYTSNSIYSFLTTIESCGSSTPFIWSEERRFYLKCELDAIYAYLYDLTRDELDYIIETFPITKRKDIEKYGRYRTKDTILQLFDQRIWE
ncbi:MAG: N-6 DNA methylase [Bacteroidetes bacterium]|nr:N-6 DNA methylase [Bacteroidota bacterium]